MDKKFKNLFNHMGFKKSQLKKKAKQTPFDKQVFVPNTDTDPSQILNLTKELVVPINPLLKHDVLVMNNQYQNKIIELKDICLEYRKVNHPNTVIFNNLNLSIFADQIVALMGPNGVGKTTLFEIITQIRKQTKGKVIFYDDLMKQNHSKYISMQSQDFSFPSGLLVKDVIRFIVDLEQIDLQENIGEYKRMLKIFKLDTVWYEKASKLSGGQQQRLNLFISLLNYPKVLLLDEYATGLDVSSRELIEQFLISYVKVHHVTLLFISHELGGLTQIAQRYLIMGNKQIMVDLPREEVIKQFGSVDDFVRYYIK